MSLAALSPSVPGVPIASRAAPVRRSPDRPLTILHVITRLERGGSADCTLLQAMGLVRRGCRVTLAAGPTGTPSPLLARARRLPDLRLVEIAPLGRAIDPLNDLRALREIVGLLRAERFDVIHTHTSKAGALGRVAALLTGRRRAVIHQPHGHLFYGYYGRAASAMIVATERLLAPLARRQITLSWRGADEHLARRVGRPGQYVAIPSGIDLAPLRRARARRAACRTSLGYHDRDVVVGSLGRLEAIKGAEDLMAAFLVAAKTRPELRLLLAGDGPLRERLATQARDAGCQRRVEVRGGWHSPEAILPAADLFVLASRNEGMGRALVEAMAIGLPVIACSVGGVPEVLEEGRAGLLVPPRDSEALAAAIGRLAGDPVLRDDLAHRGRRRALAYGAGRMVRSLMRLYREIAA